MIKESEKLPNKIKIALEKYKIINNKEYNDKLNLFINDCIKNENIIKDINIINQNIEKSKSGEKEIIFNLDENKINNFIQKIKKFGKLEKKREKKYNNFREINREVNIIEHSKENERFSLDVMLGKKKDRYSLFEGQNNHFAIFDLNKKLYLKEILISVKQGFGCVLKNFKVSIKNDEENWEKINKFCCQDNKSQTEMQNFCIEKETQFVKINFIDAWSKADGDCILIKKLSFNVADII